MRDLFICCFSFFLLFLPFIFCIVTNFSAIPRPDPAVDPLAAAYYDAVIGSHPCPSVYQDYQKNTAPVALDIAGKTLLEAANACIATHRKYPWVVKTDAGGRFINPLNMGIWPRIMASYGMRDEKFMWDNVSHLYSSFRLTEDVTYGLNQVTPLIISTRIPFGKTRVNGPRLSLAAYAFSVDGFLDVWLGAAPLNVQSSKKPTANLADKIMAGIDIGTWHGLL